MNCRCCLYFINRVTFIWPIMRFHRLDTPCNEAIHLALAQDQPTGGNTTLRHITSRHCRIANIVRMGPRCWRWGEQAGVKRRLCRCCYARKWSCHPTRTVIGNWWSALWWCRSGLCLMLFSWCRHPILIMNSRIWIKGCLQLFFTSLLIPSETEHFLWVMPLLPLFDM